MNKRYLLICILLFALPACQNLPQHDAEKHIMHDTQSSNTASLQQILSDYTWDYQTQIDLPNIQISFYKNQNFSIFTGCNQQSGSWGLSDQTITTSALRSTMMMCSSQLMLQEKQAVDLFGQSELHAHINLEQKNSPELQITDKSGKLYNFKGKTKPEVQYKSQAEIVFLDIAPTTKPCSKNPNMHCLQVKEVKFNEQGVQTYIDQNWKIFTETIEGYTHDPKVKQTIRVKRFYNKEVTPQYAYIYDMTVQQEVIQR